MQSNNKHLKSFLESVCREVSFKGIHKHISKELCDHIEDQREAFISKGMDSEEALIKAIEEMGDPTVIGRQLNDTHKPKTEWSILSIIAVLISIGAYLQYFQSNLYIQNVNQFSRFLMYAPVGVLVFLAIYFFDYTIFSRYCRPIYIALVIAMLLMAVLGKRINGTYFHVYYFSLLLIPSFAGIVYYYRNKGLKGIIWAAAYYLMTSIIILRLNAATAFVFFSIACLVILTAVIANNHFSCNKKKALSIIYTPTLLGAAILFMNMPRYMYDRLMSMINPQLDPHGSGYLALTIRRLIASAKPFGAAELGGDFTGMSPHQVLPNAFTDFSLTHMIASLGYIPAMILVGLMLLLVVRMFISVSKQKSTYGFLISFSACIAITGQIIVYVLANLGILMPVSFILPFVSFGAYGFIVNMALMGLLLSVYRRSNIICHSLDGDYAK
jgi:cell division protein FtsW (lipid II flippase)